MNVSELVEAIGAAVKRGAGTFEVKGISTDSRTTKKGDVFFALKGPNYNGHAFVKDAYAKGAIGAVVEIIPGLDPSKTYNVMVVRDTLRALGFLAGYVRGLYKIPLIAVSGSSGKTTTKDMIAAIMMTSRPVLKTEGNKNNLIGLPQTLFRLTTAHKAAVVELGVSEQGEMERLANISKPDVAVITNIGRVHLETLGTLEGVAKAKAPLFEHLKDDGTKVVNLDDPWTLKIDSVTKPSAKRVTFSLKEKADVRVLSYSLDPALSALNVELDIRGAVIKVQLHSPAICNVANAAAASAASLAAGATVEEIQQGLNMFAPSAGRMEVIKAMGATIINDTYNSNPEAVIYALLTLKSAVGGKIAVLGDMLELGAASEEAHKEVGRAATNAGVSGLIAIGAFSKNIIEGAIGAGFSAKRALAFESKAEALLALKAMIKDGDTVLVKGSRGVALEEIVEGLKKA
jgi:UDP-N-acetylmuramoyl-tripeptide--D-alanyl-D-alanine ligase